MTTRNVALIVAPPIVSCPVCHSATGAHLSGCPCQHEDARLQLKQQHGLSYVQDNSHWSLQRAAAEAEGKLVELEEGVNFHNRV